MRLGLGLTAPDLAVRQAASVPWSPLDLGSSLLAWWDAEAAGSLSLSGSSVLSWIDLKGGLALTPPSSGARPLWQATAFNGRPMVTFDGSDDTLEASAAALPSAAAPSEIWVLIDQQLSAADASNRIIAGYGSNATATWRVARRIVSTGVNRSGAQVGDNSTSVPVVGPATDLSGRHVVRLAVGAISSQVFTDTVPTGTGGAPVTVTPATGNTRIRLGASPGTTANSFFTGGINSALVTGPLADPAATQLMGWLKARGGIP